MENEALLFADEKRGRGPLAFGPRLAMTDIRTEHLHRQLRWH
jgi:hypothetical protein